MARDRRDKREDSAPPETTPSRTPHAWDASPQLQMIREVERAIGDLTSTTRTLNEDVREVRRDVARMITKGGFWGGIGVVVGVIVAVGGALGAAYWLAISTKFEALEAKLNSRPPWVAPSAAQPPQPPQQLGTTEQHE